MGKNRVKPLQHGPLEGRVGYTWPILLSKKEESCESQDRSPQLS